MAYEADHVAGHMHGAIGGVAQAAIAAWMVSRQDTGRRDAENAAAANGARAGVLRSTVHGLREQIAQERYEHREEVLDLKADVDFFRSENLKVTARMAELEAVVLRLNADCRVLVDALRDARAA